MANQSGAATTWNCPNYIGELFLVGQSKTPFLNMIGGISGGGKKTSSFLFPVAQPWALETASQPAITETASLTAPTPVTYTRSQDVNTVQIFQRKVSVSYAKQSNSGQVVPFSATQNMQQGEGATPQSELDFQIMANLQQAALDVNYTFLNGAFVAATASNVAAQSRGIITGCTSNTVAAAGATLSKPLINQLLRAMAGNGATFQNMVFLCNSFQRQLISDIFGYAPTDRNVGGLSIKQVYTDFAEVGVVWDPNVPADTLLLADLSVCFPVFCEVPGKGLLFYEALSKSGASEDGQLYGQIGLDYGPEEYHGTITGLATA